MRQTTLTTCALLLVLLHGPAPAEACSPPECWPPYLVPGDGASVPANLSAVYWRPLADRVLLGYAPDPGNVSLVDVETGVPVPFTATMLDNGDFLLELNAALSSQKQYRLADTTTCSSDWENTGDVQATFTTTASLPLPDTLGTLTISEAGIGPLVVATPDGTCDTAIIADQVVVDLEPTLAAEPWLDVLHFRTLVDGALWRRSDHMNSTYAPGESWAGRGRDRLYLVCEDDGVVMPFTGLSTGDHVVVFEASIPGTGVTLRTSPLTITMSCDEVTDDAPSCSCSIGSRESHGDGWALILFVTVLFAVGKRAVTHPKTVASGS